MLDSDIIRFRSKNKERFNVEYQKAFQHAVKLDNLMEPNDFSYDKMVIVEHEDGSQYLIKNALALFDRDFPDWLFVHKKNMPPLVFSIKVIKWYEARTCHYSLPHYWFHEGERT